MLIDQCNVFWPNPNLPKRKLLYTVCTTHVPKLLRRVCTVGELYRAAEIPPDFRNSTPPTTLLHALLEYSFSLLPVNAVFDVMETFQFAHCAKIPCRSSGLCITRWLFRHFVWICSNYRRRLQEDAQQRYPEEETLTTAFSSLPLAPQTLWYFFFDSIQSLLHHLGPSCKDLLLVHRGLQLSVPTTLMSCVGGFRLLFSGVRLLDKEKDTFATALYFGVAGSLGTVGIARPFQPFLRRPRAVKFVLSNLESFLYWYLQNQQAILKKTVTIITVT